MALSSSMRLTPNPAAPQSGLVLIARNVKRLRISLELTQQGLADRLGWSKARIVAIEAADDATVLLDDLDALGRALTVEPSALFLAHGADL